LKGWGASIVPVEVPVVVLVVGNYRIYPRRLKCLLINTVVALLLPVTLVIQ